MKKYLASLVVASNFFYVLKNLMFDFDLRIVFNVIAAYWQKIID